MTDLIEALTGTWEGEGEGHYPTIAHFAYRERITLEPLPGKPVLAYAQRTRHATEDRPLHAESGFLRLSDGRPEWLVAQPTGIVEVYEGTWDGAVLDLRATTVGRARTAKTVVALRRRLEVDGDTLRYDLWMAHGETPETHHLTAQLRRTS